MNIICVCAESEINDQALKNSNWKKKSIKHKSYNCMSRQSLASSLQCFCGISKSVVFESLICG